jgi:hypothetical protein
MYKSTIGHCQHNPDMHINFDFAGLCEHYKDGRNNLNGKRSNKPKLLINFFLMFGFLSSSQSG